MGSKETLLEGEASIIADAETERLAEQVADFTRTEAVVQEAMAGLDAELNALLDSAVPDTSTVAIPAIFSSEKYAHSLRAVRNAGRFALEQMLDTQDGVVAERILRRDFDRAIGEMLNTDAEFRDRLDINPGEIYQIHNDHVVMDDGTPVVDMIRRGYEASSKAAETDLRMRTQALRDYNDLSNAEAVDRMKPGELRLAISMDPREAMQRDGEDFWANKLGYRNGLVFVQWYYQIDAHTMKAGSYSVEAHDREKLRDTLAEYGIAVPADAASEDWITYAAETRADNVEQAAQVGADIRANYYARAGVTGRRLSVTDFIDASKSVTDQFFRNGYLPMAVSHVAGTKTGAMHAFAEALLQSPSVNVLSTKIREDLLRIRSGFEFDDDLTRSAEFMVRYGTVERLRLELRSLLVPGHKEPNLDEYRLAMVPQIPYEVIRQLAQGVLEGAAAGRIYGGCAAGIVLSAEQQARMGSDGASPEESARNLQEAFGGNRNESSVLKCVTCPLCKKEGVDAHIKIIIEAGKKQKVITCSSCKKSKSYDA